MRIDCETVITDVVRLLELSHDSMGRLTGFTMQEAHGQTLNTRAGSFPDVFLLADVIGRVAVGMSQIAEKVDPSGRAR